MMVKAPTVLITILLFFSLKSVALESSSDSVEGLWNFYKRIYQGQETIPNHVKLIFEFHSGDSRLYWEEVNDHGFCERRGKFFYNKPILTDMVTWVNPLNKYGCSNDPDMQLGRTTQTRMEVINEELNVFLPLGNDELIYVFRKGTPLK